jgi:prepilin peptidase CpaA
MSLSLLGLAGVFALATTLVVAMWFDLVSRRIPNRVVLWGSMAALVLSLAPGGVGWVSALTGGGVAFGLFLLLHAFRVVGAGDVKLVGAVGFFHGGPDVIQLCLAILLAGGVISLAWAVWTSRLKEVVRNLGFGLKHGFVYLSPVGRPETPVSAEHVPYALAIGLGTAVHWLIRS